MTYQHKKSSCVKSTSEILAENFLEVQEAEYGLKLDDIMPAVNASGTDSEPAANVLPPDEPLQDDNGEDLDNDAEQVLEQGLEDYVMLRKVTFKASDAKERIEKKEKRRNYIEFRADY